MPGRAAGDGGRRAESRTERPRGSRWSPSRPMRGGEKPAGVIAPLARGRREGLRQPGRPPPEREARAGANRGPGEKPDFPAPRKELSDSVPRRRARRLALPCRIHVVWFEYVVQKTYLCIAFEKSHSLYSRGVAQSGQRTCFGSRGSWVQIPPPRQRKIPHGGSDWNIVPIPSLQETPVNPV